MAFDHDPDFDGAMTVKETEETCEMEQNSGFQLADIHFGTKTKNGKVFLVNKTGFNEKFTDRLDDLDFVEVKGGDPKKIKKDKKDEGWTFICDSEIFAKNQTTRVLVFGRKTE